MKETPKALKDGESTYHNGGEGAICGGVISYSYRRKYIDENGDSYGIMMAYVMPDKEFELYREAKEKGDEKTSRKLFDRFARSQI